MKLFSKNKKLIVYVILFLIVLLFLYLCFQTTIEGFCKVTTEEVKKEKENIEGDICFDYTKSLSNKSTDKFQFISCIFEHKHPKINDIKVNFVIKNNDGTLFDVAGETIQTYNEDEYKTIENGDDSSNNNEQVANEEMIIFDDSTGESANTFNEVNKIVKPSHTLKLKLKPNFSNNNNVDELPEDQKENISTTDSISVFDAKIFNSDEDKGFSLTVNNENKLVYHESPSIQQGNIIDYVLPSDKFSRIKLQVNDNILNVTIKNDDLESTAGQPFKQEINLANSISENEYTFTLTNNDTNTIDIKKFSLQNEDSEQNINTETNEVTNTTSYEKPNDFIYLDLGECKYHLSALDHILLNHNNISTYENEIINLTDWVNEKSKGHIGLGLRNIIYKNCNNEIIQNYNVSSKIPMILKPYKKEDDTLELPDVYVIYNVNNYENEQEIVDNIRDIYPDKVIQIIGTFNYGEYVQDIRSYEQIINNSEYNESNIDNDSPECATTKYGCCPDGNTTMDDITGTNCKPMPCSFSQFGCCKDGVTISNDNVGSNCPVFPS